MTTKTKRIEKKKNLALVGTLEDNIFNMTEQMTLMLKRSKKNYNKFKREGKRKSKRNAKSEDSKRKDGSNYIICYECNEPGHT